MEKKSFIIAMKQFFGMRDGATLKDFKEEINQLTQKDREDFVVMFHDTLNIEIDPASVIAPKATSN